MFVHKQLRLNELKFLSENFLGCVNYPALLTTSFISPSCLYAQSLTPIHNQPDGLKGVSASGMKARRRGRRASARGRGADHQKVEPEPRLAGCTHPNYKYMMRPYRIQGRRPTPRQLFLTLPKTGEYSMRRSDGARCQT